MRSLHWVGLLDKFRVAVQGHQSIMNTILYVLNKIITYFTFTLLTCLMFDFSCRSTNRRSYFLALFLLGKDSG